jgi:hypothetical protein
LITGQTAARAFEVRWIRGGVEAQDLPVLILQDKPGGPLLTAHNRGLKHRGEIISAAGINIVIAGDIPGSARGTGPIGENTLAILLGEASEIDIP